VVPLKRISGPVGAWWTSIVSSLTTNTSASISRPGITNRSPEAGVHSSPAARKRSANSTEIMRR
jgi:hypothetical protein